MVRISSGWFYYVLVVILLYDDNYTYSFVVDSMVSH